MPNISIVIITKNEASNIAACIQSARKISDDIIVIDSGSTDATKDLAVSSAVRLYSIQWNGYGHSRNLGAKLAFHDWIFSLDADERVTDDLAAHINKQNFADDRLVYGFRRLNFFGNIRVKHGALRHDRVFRIYNRTTTQWNDVPVHERLVGRNSRRKLLKPYIVHYGIKNETHYFQKKTNYAFLCAMKYKQERRKFVAALRILSPVYNFVQAYFFQLGFLDKRIGFTIARINAYYTSEKYRHLYLLLKKEKRKRAQPGVMRSSLKWISSLLS